MTDRNGSEIYPGCTVRIFDCSDYALFGCDKWFINNNGGVYQVDDFEFGKDWLGTQTFHLVNGHLPDSNYSFIFPYTCAEVIVEMEDIPNIQIGEVLL